MNEIQILESKAVGESIDEIVVAMWLDQGHTQPMNLNGFSAKMQFREVPESKPVVEYGMADGTLTIAGNVIACKTFLPGISRAGTYLADLFLTEPGGVTQVINRYSLTVIDTYTR